MDWKRRKGRVQGIAFAGSSTDAALALGAFAALGTILMGAAAFGHPAIAAPPPVVYAPPEPPAVYAPAPPVVYAPPPPVVYAPPAYRHRHYGGYGYAYDDHGYRWRRN